MATVWWLEAPLVLLTTSTLLVATSAIVASAPKQPAMLAWALADLYDDDDDADDDDDDDSDGKRQSRGVVLGMPAVMMYPLLASILLVGMYWFTAYVSWLLLLSHIVSGVFGMSVGLDAALLLLLLLLSGSPSSSRAATSTTATGESSMFQSRLCAAIAILCVGAWIWTNSVVLANVIAMSLCITMAAVIRVQSLKVITVLLAALFFYDIFWVFFSAHLFGSNVMLEVAAQTAPNPLQELVPVMKHAAPELELPVKLVYGGMMLGLGDIALPALLACLSRRIDLSHKYTCATPASRGFELSYLAVTVASYFIGLSLCMVALLSFNSAQPALLYIVPAMLGGVLTHARARGELDHLWHQPIATHERLSRDVAASRV